MQFTLTILGIYYTTEIIRIQFLSFFALLNPNFGWKFSTYENSIYKNTKNSRN